MKKPQTLKIAVILLLLAGGLASCKEPDDPCMVRVRPKNLPPIDWENYNSIYTIISTYNGIIEWNPWMYADTGRTIKVYGWVDRLDHPYRDFFTLRGSAVIDNTSISHDERLFVWISGEPDAVMRKFREMAGQGELSKKIFIRGTFRLIGFALVSGGPPHYCGGSLVSGGVRIYGIDDFYFE
jgi:hypothetical protein